MFRILVCVKQVPEVTDVTVDTETGTLNREGVASILNPFCEYALDLALELRHANPQREIEIVAVTMGPPQARAALMRCLEMGAERAVLLTDRRFAGADTWATALTIAGIVGKLGDDIDLILVGKHAIDGDTAQTGPELAECLGLPQVTYAVDLELEGGTKKKASRWIRVRRETERGYEVLRMKLPGLVSVSRGAPLRQVCSLDDILGARNKEIATMTADDVGIAEAELGLAGSLTQVVRIFPPPARAGGEVIDGSDPGEAARRLVGFLRERELV